MASAPDKRLRIELPDAERGRSPDALRRFDKLQRKLLHPKTTLKEREAALAEIEQMERAPAERADATWAKAATEESEQLAQARGETVTSERGGVKRILDRDPILSLARAGHLNEEQIETATQVRDLYDRRAEAMGSGEFTGMPGSPHNHEAFVLKAHARAKACQLIGRIERAVAIQCSAEPVCLTSLRIVCERGMALSTQGRGRAFERHVEAFVRALEVADPILRRQA